MSKRTLLVAGAGLYVSIAGTTYVYLRGKQGSADAAGGFPAPQAPSSNGDGAQYDCIAPCYDKYIGWDETLMGVNLLRWWTLRRAKGHCLEVSAGTGRNLPYYDYSAISSLTMTDTSVRMLEEAYDKATAMAPPGLPSESLLICQANAERLGQCSAKASSSGCRIQPCPEAVAKQKYDTVVDTFGLCSHADPVAALRGMQAVCKPGGRILLIEHGRSHWAWLNNALDGSAAAHHSKWGCWWNRDIAGLVEAAGLHVESMQRWHFGTTYVIEATIPQNA